MIHFLCPKCDSLLSASPRKMGRLCTCPKCRNTLQVPALPLESDVERVPGSSWKKVLVGVRIGAWIGCLGLVGAVAWPYVETFQLGEMASIESWSAAGPCVLLLGGYIVARAVDSLAKW